jgi:energy-coupling factor transporter ATP-binding protein EcfA2
VEKQGSIIYLEDITVSFDGFQVLRGVDFYVDRGELRALIGPNGAGKTTLLDVICGKVKPATGELSSVTHGSATLEEHEITMLGMGANFRLRPSLETSRWSRTSRSPCTSHGACGRLLARWVLPDGQNRPHPGDLGLSTSASGRGL